MEFVATQESVFVIGSCVSGDSVSSVFSIGSCVSNEEKNEEEVIPKLDIEASRKWIIDQRYVGERNTRNPYFTGPTYESNWLIRKTSGSKYGSFAVGSYPDNPTYFENLKQAGLETFVCLNSEYGLWSKGQYFQKYGDSLPKDRFIHERIDDMGIVNDAIIIHLAEEIVRRIKNGENVYLHCAGGHGRTGTVAIVVLNMLYPDLNYIELFEYVQYSHDQRGGNYFGNGKFVYKMVDDHLAYKFVEGQVPSPQTIAQRTQVRRIIRTPPIL